MRSAVALVLLIVLCAAANAAPVHYYRARQHMIVRPGPDPVVPVIPPGWYRFPGYPPIPPGEQESRPLDPRQRLRGRAHGDARRMHRFPTAASCKASSLYGFGFETSTALAFSAASIQRLMYAARSRLRTFSFSACLVQASLLMISALRFSAAS